MTDARRRAFQAEMTGKYCEGNARLDETVCGWRRHTMTLSLAERLTDLICLGAQAAFSGRKRWEEPYPYGAATLRQLAEAHAHQNLTFCTLLASTGLTANGSFEALRRVQG